MEPHELEAHVRRLAALEEIRALKGRYCRWSDRGYDGAGDSPDEVAALFTADGAWGEARGREAIRALFERFRTALPFALHMALEPEIELDGERARGRWSGIIDVVSETDGPTLILGIYDDQLALTSEGWRFTHVTFTSHHRVALPPPRA